MPPRVLDLHYTLRYAAPLIMLLEAQTSTWQTVLGLAAGLVERLPGRWQGLYFLGNRTRYSLTLARDLREQAPAWYSANQGRVSCVGPQFEALEQERFSGRIVVLTSQMPVDLEDWLDTATLSRLLMIGVGEGQASLPVEQIEGRQGVEAILTKLEDPPRTLQIQGPGFVPLTFDIKEGGAVQVQETDGEFQLNITPGGERLDLHLRALANEPPDLIVQHQKSRATRLAGEPEAPWRREQLWQPLPDALRPVVEAGIANRSFVCPQCGESHPSHCLLCPRGDLILKGMPLNTFILLTRTTWLSLADSFAYPLSDNRLLARNGQLYRWNKERWELHHTVHPYEQVDDDRWAIFHTF